MFCALRLLVACREASVVDAVQALARPLGCAVEFVEMARLRPALQGTGYDVLCVDAQPPGCDDVRAAVDAAAALPAAVRPRVIGIAMRAPAARACGAVEADVITVAALAETLAGFDATADADLVDIRMLTSLRELQDPGSPDLFKQLSQMFREDGRRRLDRLHEAVAAGDREQLQRAAHSLKGSAANLGACRLARICAVMESEAANAPLPLLDALVSRAARVFNASVEAIDRL